MGGGVASLVGQACMGEGRGTKGVRAGSRCMLIFICRLLS